VKPTELTATKEVTNETKKLMSLKQTPRKNIKHFYRSINEFKKGYQPIT
jgi:hypothetical protein